MEARFVGHPLADELPLEPDRDAAREALGLDPTRPVLALLPGSRVGEIARLGPDFLAAAARVLRRKPNCRSSCPWPTRVRMPRSSACSPAIAPSPVVGAAESTATRARS